VDVPCTTCRGGADADGARWPSAATGAKWLPLLASTLRRATPALECGLARLFHVLRRLSFRPRIVAVSEYQAVRHGGMRVEPESDKRRRIRIRQIQFPNDLKRVRSNLFRIRNEAVNHFQAVHIRCVLLHAADPVDCRRRDKKQDLQHEERTQARSPIFWSRKHTSCAQ